MGDQSAHDDNFEFRIAIDTRINRSNAIIQDGKEQASFKKNNQSILIQSYIRNWNKDEKTRCRRSSAER